MPVSATQAWAKTAGAMPGFLSSLRMNLKELVF
jgi:hypothetical protein